MKIPTIHLNGTSKEALVRQLEEADNAIYTALEKLCEASPNARDYYPQGPGAFDQANDEHRSRIQRLHDVREEIQQIMREIA